MPWVCYKVSTALQPLLIAAAGGLWVPLNLGCCLLEALDLSIVSFLASIPGSLWDIQPGHRALSLPGWEVGVE